MSEEEEEEQRRQQQQQQMAAARGYPYEPAEPHAEGKASISIGRRRPPGCHTSGHTSPPRPPLFPPLPPPSAPQARIRRLTRPRCAAPACRPAAAAAPAVVGAAAAAVRGLRRAHAAAQLTRRGAAPHQPQQAADGGIEAVRSGVPSGELAGPYRRRRCHACRRSCAPLPPLHCPCRLLFAALKRAAGAVALAAGVCWPSRAGGAGQQPWRHVLRLPGLQHLHPRPISHPAYHHSPCPPHAPRPPSCVQPAAEEQQATRDQLLDAVSEHFAAQQVDESEVIACFLSSVKRHRMGLPR